MTKQVPLTRGQYAIVDDEDYDRVMQHKWHAKLARSGKFYPERSVRGKHLPLANFILDVPRGTLVDHINREPLDNRRVNLRVATWIIQNRNLGKQRGDYTSQHVGVGYVRRNNTWRARISLGRWERLQRYFKTEQEAIQQRKAWEQEFGWFDDKQSTEEQS